MSVLDAINGAREHRRPKSKSEVEWARLSEPERGAVVAGLLSGDIGPGKMAEVLTENGYQISRHFLSIVAKENA